jgi:cell division protein FtsA
LKNLSKIINARVIEIIELVFNEIKNYGHEESSKKLIAGIVLTGGGSQLKHIKQLVEYITGMDTRIGYPNEHLAGNSSEEIAIPLYATSVGLVMNSVENNTKSASKIQVNVPEKTMPTYKEPIKEVEEEKSFVDENTFEEESTEKKLKNSFLDGLLHKVKDFLDKAE